MLEGSDRSGAESCCVGISVGCYPNTLKMVKFAPQLRHCFPFAGQGSLWGNEPPQLRNFAGLERASISSKVVVTLSVDVDSISLAWNALCSSLRPSRSKAARLKLGSRNARLRIFEEAPPMMICSSISNSGDANSHV